METAPEVNMKSEKGTPNLGKQSREEREVLAELWLHLAFLFTAGPRRAGEVVRGPGFSGRRAEVPSRRPVCNKTQCPPSGLSRLRCV